MRSGKDSPIGIFVDYIDSYKNFYIGNIIDNTDDKKKIKLYIWCSSNTFNKLLNGNDEE